MLRGNFGWSFRTGQPVAALIVSRLPITIEMAVLAVLSVALVAIPLGVVASVSRSLRVRTLVQIIGRSRALHAELLDRDPAHHRRVVALRLAARDHLRDPVDGPVGEPAADVPSRAVAVPRALRGRRAHDAVLDARGAGPGLHPRRPRQGTRVARHPPAARAPERARPDRHGPRAPDRASSWAAW